MDRASKIRYASIVRAGSGQPKKSFGRCPIIDKNIAVLKNWKEADSKTLIAATEAMGLRLCKEHDYYKKLKR